MKIEMWESKAGRFMNLAQPPTWREALMVIDIARVRRRKRIRVRHFYDRHLRDRVVQILVGNGYGSRS